MRQLFGSKKNPKMAMRYIFSYYEHFDGKWSHLVDSSKFREACEEKKIHKNYRNIVKPFVQERMKESSNFSLDLRTRIQNFLKESKKDEDENIATDDSQTSRREADAICAIVKRT